MFVALELFHDPGQGGFVDLLGPATRDVEVAMGEPEVGQPGDARSSAMPRAARSLEVPVAIGGHILGDRLEQCALQPGRSPDSSDGRGVAAFPVRAGSSARTLGPWRVTRTTSTMGAPSRTAARTLAARFLHWVEQ